MEITEWDPPRRCVVTHHGRVVRGDGVFEVIPLGQDRAEFRWTERLDLPLGAVGRLGWPLVRPAFRSGVGYSLRRLARLCEARHRGMREPVAERSRCGWATSAPEYVAYHDDEWGRPLHGSTALFERLSLEAFQSGLSWLVILRKRPAFRVAFAGFEPAAVADFGPADVQRLLADAGIVRNRAKIDATVHNARQVLALDVPLDELLWTFAPDPAGRDTAGHAGRGAGDLTGVDGDGSRAEAPRLPFRRAHHLLRVDAGGGPRRRSRADLLAGRTVSVRSDPGV